MTKSFVRGISARAPQAALRGSARARFTRARDLALGATIALSSVGLAPVPAQAGAPESLESLAQHPTDPNKLVLHYEDGYGGILASSNGGKTFDILPGLAFTKSGLYREHPAMRLVGDGKLIVGSPWDGLFVSSDDKGCIKPTDRVQPGFANDVAAHPTDNDVVFFVDGMAGDQRGLWKRDAAGVLSQLGPADPDTFTPQGLVVVSRAASAEQLRFVEVGSVQSGPANMPVFSPVLRISDDLGKTWIERPIPVADDDGGTPRLVAVSGSDTLKLVISLFRDGSPDPLDPILYSTDSGATFNVYPVQIGKTGQALIAPDGKLYMADMGTSTTNGGLWMASDIGEPLSKLADYSVHCLGYDESSEQLLLCKAYELGRFDPTSRSYCRMYQLNETANMLCDLSTFPKFSEGDSTTVVQSVKMQMCYAWCGAAHYASSPFCSIYNDRDIICGPSARAYDLEGGPGGSWVEPPGTDEPRCAGFEPAPPADAGVSDAGSGNDAAVNGDGDAGTVADAGAPNRDGGQGAPAKKGDGGCSLSAGAGQRATSWFAALSLLLAVRLRRRARA